MAISRISLNNGPIWKIKKLAGSWEQARPAGWLGSIICPPTRFFYPSRTEGQASYTVETRLFSISGGGNASNSIGAGMVQSSVSAR